jgi:hypothetical protein
MEKVFLYVSIALCVVVIVAALRSIFQRTWPFLRKVDEEKQAYVVLVVAAVGMFAWSHYSKKMHLTSVEFLGVKTQVDQLDEKVTSLSNEMEIFFGKKKIEVFDRRNWNRIRKVGKSEGHFILEVTLEHEPIRNSVEVFAGVLPMPEQDYSIKGSVLRFPANTDKPTEDITIKYYPRALPSAH